MSIRVALHHKTVYTYDKRVSLGPQIVRLRPAPHCRTPIHSYSLKVEPADHFVNWQQDPHSNYLARFVFQEKTQKLSVEVDLIAEMTVINPFDFFVEDSAKEFPFEYDEWLSAELTPFLEKKPLEPKFQKFIDEIDRSTTVTVDFLVALNSHIQRTIEYQVRMEPGVQTPEETLTLGKGSCRDSGWLLVQTLRHLGLASRFVSGYLIQLKPDVLPIDGPVGSLTDFCDLHAWAEVFLPGAGWVGLDPTSGLLAGEGHIPLACTPEPMSAAPISGALEKCEVEFDFSMSITRIEKEARVTKPYTEATWAAIEQLGHHVDSRLKAEDVRLTMGGEPTFVSIDDMEGAEWNTAAVGEKKRALSEVLINRLRTQFAKGGLLHYGQGKWYPGEPLPRWALSCFWRKDGVPIWNDPKLIAEHDRDYGLGLDAARRFSATLAQLLEVSTHFIHPAYEDVFHYLLKERRLPPNIQADSVDLRDADDRASLAAALERGLNQPTGFVMPLTCQSWQARHRKWISGAWPVRSERLFLQPGDSPLGLRLPLDSLPWVPVAQRNTDPPIDPMVSRPPLPNVGTHYQHFVQEKKLAQPITGVTEQLLPQEQWIAERMSKTGAKGKKKQFELPSPTNVVRTALCIEPRKGKLHIFLPPVAILEDYLDLVAAIEATATALQMPIVLEGYLPPHDDRLDCIKVTPDPGVIEVNVHPSATWDELVERTTILYEEASQTRLGTEKFDLDGKHSGTGGGNHIVLGGSTPSDSPFLRRPDLLKSFVAYWQNHPSLSYLFSGRFIGPTSQAPRVDEGRRDALYELELALSLIPPRGQHCPPWLVDRIFRNLLVDLTGNTHRAEFCIDKLYSPDSSTGRLGLVELRGFEMPPHSRMSLAQQLLIRALVMKFWDQPFEEQLVDWGTSLHDRFLLPHFVWSDFSDVLSDLNRAGFAFDREWFKPHFEFRFPVIGNLQKDNIELELRSAIEPWYVLGDEPAGGGTVRFVDSSVERIQVLVSGLTGSRHVVTCNGRRVPLHPTGMQGQYVAAVRYRAWWPASCLHPTIPLHTPLVFDILDRWTERSVGGCTYHVAHPAGRNYETFPVNSYEAEARRVARFFPMGHTPGSVAIPSVEENSFFPLTLDLRRPLI